MHIYSSKEQDLSLMSSETLNDIYEGCDLKLLTEIFFPLPALSDSGSLAHSCTLLAAATEPVIILASEVVGLSVSTFVSKVTLTCQSVRGRLYPLRSRVSRVAGLLAAREKGLLWVKVVG